MILGNRGYNIYDVNKKNLKRDRHEWKVEMTLISYPCLDSKWYEYGSIGANIA
jgi:hypothetical protein